jgi:4-oxalocrotonate tautomerase
MPLVRISVNAWTWWPSKQAKVADAVYQAMRETIDIPEGDRFILVTSRRGDAGSYIDPTFMGMHRTNRFVLVEITLSQGRSVEQKQALFARIAERLQQAIGISTDDVMTVLRENTLADWSFGKGIAQYVVNPPAWAQQPAPGD